MTLEPSSLAPNDLRATHTETERVVWLGLESRPYRSMHGPSAISFVPQDEEKTSRKLIETKVTEQNRY